MIKKSVFENDLIAGMQRELRSHDQKQGFANLEKAADYLNSAVQILEEAGMTAKADKVLMILAKIATKTDTRVKEMPSLKALVEKGVKMEDLKNLGKGDAFSKARVNTAFRRLGYTDKEISHLIGHHNLMHEKEAAQLLSPERSFEKIKEWIKDPHAPISHTDPQAKDSISFTSIAQNLHDSLGRPVSDRHTNGLTPEKMTKNLQDHGSVFNLSDDGAADDLLNADIDNNNLEVFDEDKPFDNTD
jgi:hypothetical protein